MEIDNKVFCALPFTYLYVDSLNEYKVCSDARLSSQINTHDMSIIEYFSNGKNWGNGGIQEVIEDIYKLNKRGEFLNKFINEAIRKLKSNQYNSSQRKLSSNYQKD